MFVLLVFNDTFSTNSLYRVIGVRNIYCIGPRDRNIDKPNKKKIHTNTLFHLGFVEVIPSGPSPH